MVEAFLSIKKESPNEGTETTFNNSSSVILTDRIKKESPNEGTETDLMDFGQSLLEVDIKKESPNEGTETSSLSSRFNFVLWSYKKRIPE